MDDEQKAQIKEVDETISKIYHSRDGGRTAYKLWLDAKAKNPDIKLDWVKGWLRNNVDPTKQIGGARNSYVAPHAYFEYQVDLVFITKRQFPNQTLRIGMSMIDVFTKFAAVIPIKSRFAVDVIPALFRRSKS